MDKTLRNPLANLMAVPGLHNLHKKASVVSFKADLVFYILSIPVVSLPICLRYRNMALILHLFPKSSTSGSGHLNTII